MIEIQNEYDDEKRKDIWKGPTNENKKSKSQNKLYKLWKKFCDIFLTPLLILNTIVFFAFIYSSYSSNSIGDTGPPPDVDSYSINQLIQLNYDGVETFFAVIQNTFDSWFGKSIHLEKIYSFMEFTRADSLSDYIEVLLIKFAYFIPYIMGILTIYALMKLPNIILNLIGKK